MERRAEGRPACENSPVQRRRRPRPLLRRPEALEGILDRAGEARHSKRPAPIGAREWSDAVGPRVASRALPVALDRGVLTVKVVTSSWAQELSLLEPVVVDELRKRGHAVTRLRFRVGALPLPERPVERSRFAKVPPPATLPVDLERAIAAIEDAALREAITAAARANLGWQENFGGPEAPTSGPPPSRAPRDAGAETAPLGRSGARESGGG